jgi:hypothetical protein
MTNELEETGSHTMRTITSSHAMKRKTFSPSAGYAGSNQAKGYRS